MLKNYNNEIPFYQSNISYLQLKRLMVMDDHDDVEQEVVVVCEEEDIDTDGQMQVPEVQSGHDHDHEEAEVQEELLVAEPDVQEDSDIEEEEQIQFHVQGAVQSDAVWGCLESVGHVQFVEPEPDAMQRYLEDSGP